MTITHQVEPYLDAIAEMRSAGVPFVVIAERLRCAGGTVRKLMLERRRALQAAVIANSTSSITLPSIRGWQ